MRARQWTRGTQERNSKPGRPRWIRLEKSGASPRVRASALMCALSFSTSEWRGARDVSSIAENLSPPPSSPQRGAKMACAAMRKNLYQRAWGAVEIDFRSYFTTIPHPQLLDGSNPVKATRSYRTPRVARTLHSAMNAANQNDLPLIATQAVQRPYEQCRQRKHPSVPIVTLDGSAATFSSRLCQSIGNESFPHDAASAHRFRRTAIISSHSLSKRWAVNSNQDLTRTFVPSTWRTLLRSATRVQGLGRKNVPASSSPFTATE